MAILRNRSTGAVLADSMAFAVPPLRHVVGLLLGSGYEIAENIWLERCRGVHTLGLRFVVEQRRGVQRRRRGPGTAGPRTVAGELGFGRPRDLRLEGVQIAGQVL